MTSISTLAGAPPRDRLELTGLAALIGCVGVLQLSIVAAQACLALTLVCWAVSLAVHHERIEAPRFFLPLVLYAGLTLISAAASADPVAGLADSKQLLLFALVPAVYYFARRDRARVVVNVLISVGALSAAVGIAQYGILHYDNLGQRPRGTLGHYMTYSGLLMLVISAAAARVLFETRDRLWPALVMPALLVAVAVTFTRSAWVGASVAVALLCVIKDRRLLAVVPILVALFFAVAPARLTDRFLSIFDPADLTGRDRIAMLKAGAAMVVDHPLTGVGPNMVERVYPQYRDPMAVERVAPHLHNVPMQIAAERGLPALAVWIWFIGRAAMDLLKKIRSGRDLFLPATGLASIAAMLTAGFFEYNFGDSEFLMLFLVLITLPFAADRDVAS
jgi:O-antigen ligase